VADASASGAHERVAFLPEPTDLLSARTVI
jgi:hypothetical protein